jgi:4-amino-4-deoxy-L-arabinose transferase-like glycosyltransferase
MALVAVLFCAPLFANLGARDYDNDEAIYSFAVDAMLRTGDWITPRNISNEATAFLEKPPLKFWIAGLPIRWGLLPHDEFGMRFWDAVMGGVAFLYVFAIGRRLAGPVCGFTAVLLLFAHAPLVHDHGLRTNNMEAAIVLAYAGGMYHVLAWRTAGPDARGHVFAMALYVVLGFMTKFVAVLFLPAAIGLAALLTHDGRVRLWLQRWTFALAALVAAALIAPWFVYEYFARGPRLFDIMFGAHVVKRFTAYLDPAHLHPWHFYATELWRHLQEAGSEWLVLAGAVLILARTIRRRWLEGALLVLWLAPLAVISTGTSKLYHYAYPFLPPVALAGGYAAAVAVGWTWRLLRAPAAALTQARDRSLPRVLAAAPMRAGLVALGVAALALAAATSRLGRVAIESGGEILFRNSSVARPLVAGVLAIAIGARAVAVRAIAAGLLWMSLAPIQAYGTTIAEIARAPHPLRAARGCLSGVIAREAATGRPAPGVWVEARLFSYTYTYYLQGLGPWQVRSDVASDPTVAMHLYSPADYRPVLLGAERYDEFRARLGQDPADLLARAAAKAGLPFDEMQIAYDGADVGVLPLSGAVLLLPGPYRGCAPEPFPAVSR